MGNECSWCLGTIGHARVCPQRYESIDSINVSLGTDLTTLNPDGDCEDVWPEWLLDTELASPNDWALELTLYDFLRFDSELVGFEFSIYGSCESDECDLFWGFGDGQKYISFFNNFDGHSWTSEGSTSGIFIYPQCGGALANGDISDVLQDSSSYHTSPDYAIRDALAGGDRSNWHLITTKKNGNGFWPVTIRVFNDISSNRVTFSFTSPNITISCDFTDSFAADQTLTFALQPDLAAGTANDIKIDGIAVDS